MKVGNMKRLFTLLLAVAMLLSAVPFEVFAQGENSVNTENSGITLNAGDDTPVNDTPVNDTPVNVASASELEEAIASDAGVICITADFEIDRTYYITRNVIILSSEPHTLTRKADFVGDIFVVGENAEGTPCENKVVLTVGTAGTQQSDMLTIDGNKENMTAAVVGTVFFACLNGQVDLHPDLTVTNCEKKGNVRALDKEQHSICNDRTVIGGAVGIVVTDSQMNIYGGKYLDNGVAESGTSGGAFFNHGTINVYDGVFTGGYANRGGVFFNYRVMTILKGTFESNTSHTTGGAIDMPSTTGAKLYVGGETKTESAQVIFKNNASTTSYGGAIGFTGGEMVLRNALFEQNTAAKNGGAVFGTCKNGGIRVYDSTFVGNTASMNGGAIAISDTKSSVNAELMVFTTTFTGNSADDNGGSVYVGAGSRAYLRDVSFQDSSAASGGAMYLVATDGEAVSTAELNHVTFTENSATSLGGCIYLGSLAQLTANDVTATENTAGSGAFSYSDGGTQNLYNSSICSNTASKASAMYFDTDAVANLYNCTINDNVCSTTNTSNAGALFIYTGGTKVTLNHCTLSGNTSSGLGGALLISGKSLVDLFDITASDNSAAKGGFMYETAADTVVTISGLTVEGNTATAGGPIIWGNTFNADLYINKTNYLDKDTAAPYGDDYWTAAIYNKLTVYDSEAQVPTYEEYEQPEWDVTPHPDVYTSAQLAAALNAGFEEIRILRSFAIDRTYYVTANTHLIVEDAVTLTRVADFGGDIFVVGEQADGTACAEGVTLTVGTPESTNKDVLVIDGNKDNMTVDVTGSVFFVCGNSCVNLHGDVSVNNCEKNGNALALQERHQLSSKPKQVGGAVAVIAGQGEMNVLGGSYKNNSSSENGGAFFNYGDLTIAQSNLRDNIAENGGAIFNYGDLSITQSDLSDNLAENGGAVYACYGTLAMVATVVSDNTAVNNGGAVMLEGDVVYTAAGVTFDDNTADNNGGALCINTDATHVALDGTTFTDNTAGNNGGVVYADGFSVIELRGTVATGNRAENGAVLYAAGTSVDATIDGLTVSNNKANTAGDLVCGPSPYATLWLNKTDYTDEDEEATPDDAYWSRVIAGSINVQSASDPAPVIDGEVVDVSSAKQLEIAIDKKSPYIRIVADFELDRTYYITSEITIFSDEPHTLTRSAYFGGDLFVVGETAGGAEAILASSVVRLTLGNPQSEKPNLLVIDGNMDNMQETVKGSVFFVCYGGQVDLYDNVTIQNCYKQDNEKTYNTSFQLSRPNRVGGSVAVISNGTVTVHGGNYKNNKVNLEDSTTEEGRNSSIGGVFYNEGNLYILGGTFDGNEGARGGIVYNYQTVRITAGTFINNVGTKYGAVYYAPSSCVAQLALGNTEEDGEKVLVKSNTARLGAGAIYSSHFSAVLILGNTSFKYNTVTAGDGGVVSVVGAFIAKDTEFVGNSASSDGGALYLSRSNNDEITRLMHLTNCTFKDNKAKAGGAVFVTSGAAEEYSKGAKVTVTDCSFENNTATGEAGAMYVINKSHVDLTNNSFKENTAGTHGGALSLRSAYVTINGDQFIGNTSKSNGGAMYLAYSSAMDINVHVTINDAIYKNNSGVYGGAFYHTRRAVEEDAVLLNVKNTTFEGNSASKDGGAGLLTAGVKTYFADVNFVDNTAKDEGGAIQIISNSLFEMDGGSFSGNSAKYGGGVRVTGNGTAVMNNITATDNTATSLGGWLHNEGGVLKLYDSTVTGNSAGDGGAMYLYTGAVSNINNTDFHENRASSSGAALFIYTGNTETVVHSCDFQNNEATSSGGGLYISGESLAKLYNTTATGNRAAKGGFAYITKASTVVDMVGLTVSGNTAAEGGSIIWGNTANAVLNIDKTQYVDSDVETIDETYWTTAIANLLTVNDVAVTAPAYTPYEGKAEPETPPVKTPVSVEDVFKLGESSSDASINSSYNKLPRLDNSSNLMSRSTATYPNINGKDVMVDTYVYPTNGKADNGVVGLGILIYQSLLYKKANPQQEMYIDVSAYRFSVQAAININRNSRYFGYERDLVGKEYDEYGFVRLSYLLITAAKMGIHVNVIGQLDGYPIDKNEPNFYEYFTQKLEDPCDPQYAEGKVIGDYLDFNFAYWTLDAKGGTDMMHTKMCTVSHYLDMNGVAREKAVWSSSSNLDGVKSDGRNANWKQQTASTITNHDELYRVSVNYLRLISSLCGQEDIIEFQDMVNARSTQQIDLLLAGKGDEIPADEQIVYIGTEQDDVFELYFTPFGGSRLAWSETYNPYCKYLREMYESEDYILFTWTVPVYSDSWTLGSQMAEMITKSFVENKNPKNKIFSEMPGFDHSAFDSLVVGKDIGYKSFDEQPNGKIHNKDMQLSYVKDGQRYFVTLLNSLNMHSGSMYYQSNFMLVVKEKSCAENGVFSTIARYTTTGNIAAHSYGTAKTAKDGTAYRTCVYCGHETVERNVDLTKLNGVTFKASSSSAIKVNTNITTAPRTLEARIQIPKSLSDRAGVIVGNYSESGDAIINLEGATNGRIKLYIKNGEQELSHTFKKDVRSDSPVDIAVRILDDQAILYVNGNKSESVALNFELPTFVYNMKVGGDNRKGNTQYFKGRIYNVHLFSNVRSVAKVRKDHLLVSNNAAGLIYSDYYAGTAIEKTNTTKLNALTFTAKKLNRLSGALDAVPKTIEATISLPKSVTGRGGVIFGNYNSSYKAPLNVEIAAGGKVRLYFRNGDKIVSHVFKPDVRTSSGTTHIALTLSGRTATLYVNGVQAETAKLSASIPKATKNFCVGGDNRTGNTQYFKGKIYAVNVFSDVRTASEIKKDATLVTSSAPNLMYSAYMTSTAGTKVTMDGQTFTSKKLNKLSGALEAAPQTIEATISLPKSVTGRGGVIFGNYNSSYKAPLNVEIAEGGKVRLYFKNGSTTVSHVFKPDVRTSSGTTHIALTLSGKTATLYVNGVKKETVTLKASVPKATKNFCIGGDNRTGNTQYFKGKIYAVNVFSDVRTASEIKADAMAVTTQAASVLYSGYFCNEPCGIGSLGKTHTTAWKTVYAATGAECGIKQKVCTACDKVLAVKEIM